MSIVSSYTSPQRHQLNPPDFDLVQGDQSKAVRFVLLTHWSYVKGAVINKVWEWNTHTDPDQVLTDIAQHLMRSEISNSFFADPYDIKDYQDTEVKILTRREINRSRKIMTLNFVFSLPQLQNNYGRQESEQVVHCLTIGMKILSEELEEIFLANQNVFVLHCKHAIDRFSKIYTTKDAPAPRKVTEEALKCLDSDVENIMVDIEYVLCPRNQELSRTLREERKLLHKFYEDGHSREDVKVFLKRALFNHFRYSFYTVVIGTEEKVNSLISFLECYLLEHEQDCKRFCLCSKHRRIIPFMPLQGIFREKCERESKAEENLKRLFDRSSADGVNSENIFFSKCPTALADVDSLKCWKITSLEDWSTVSEASKKYHIEKRTGKNKTTPIAKDFPFQKSEDTHPWIDEHIERLEYIPEKLKRAYMTEFRNLMLRKALILKRPIQTYKKRSEQMGVDLASLKKLWWMMEDPAVANCSRQGQAVLDTELLVGWLEHVCPNLGFYTLRTQPGRAVAEINL